MPYNTGRAPILGEFYIQNENQDFWLYELVNGVPTWVRKGNIRDEGTGGLITVPPVWAHGFDMEVVHLDRWRYVPGEATPVDLTLGFSTDITALDRIRYLAPVNCQLGLAVSVDAVQRIKHLTAAFALGHVTQAQLSRSIQIEAAMALGFTAAAALDAGVVKNIVAAMTVGFDQATGDPYRARMISVGFDQGLFQATTLQKTENLVVAPSLGFDMVASILRIKSITAAFALGYAQDTAVSGYFGTKYIPTNTVFAGAVTPSAVETTFTFSASGGASQGNLYDGSITTPAADPDGVKGPSRDGTQASGLVGATRAAYDLGSDVAVTGVTIYTAPANGVTSAFDVKVQYSDVGLTSGWTDTGVTITVPAGTSQVVSAGVNAGAHRYWRIIYVSGSTSTNNAWLGELVFSNDFAPWSEGASMSVAVQRIKYLAASIAMAEGLSMSAAVSKIKAIAAAPSLGASMAVTALSRTRYLTIAMALGSSQANTVTHNLPAGTVYTPTAVLTTFTFTGQTPPASEAALYDGSDTTDAADARGLQTDTSAAYDLGTARTLGSVRVVNSPRFVSSGNITYKVQYSDTGLTGSWTDAGASVTMTTTLGNVQTASIGAVGAHRYWRIVYVSGNIASNAWLGALQFRS